MPPENNIPPSPQTPVSTDSKAKDLFPPKIFIILILLAGILGSYQVFYSEKPEKVENLEFKKELTIVDTSTWQTYRNAEYGFSIKYPLDWRIDEEYSSILFYSVTGEMEAKEKVDACIKKLVNADSSVCAVPYIQDLTFSPMNLSVQYPTRENQTELVINNSKWIRFEYFGKVYYQFDKGSVGYSFSAKDEKILKQILSTFELMTETSSLISPCSHISNYYKKLNDDVKGKAQLNSDVIKFTKEGYTLQYVCSSNGKNIVIFDSTDGYWGKASSDLGDRIMFWVTDNDFSNGEFFKISIDGYRYEGTGGMACNVDQILSDKILFVCFDSGDGGYDIEWYLYDKADQKNTKVKFYSSRGEDPKVEKEETYDENLLKLFNYQQHASTN